MNTDRFIRHATRGLWGQKKRDVALELRGAIEDKVWRHTLLGLSLREAEQAALRDLGSPHVIARDLNRVHTAPTALRATLLLGITGLLSLQAVAQIKPVQSTFLPQDLQNCAFPTGQAMGDRNPALQARLDRILKQHGGAQGLAAACQAGAFAAAGSLLSVTDLLDALKAAQVPINTTGSTTLLMGGTTGSTSRVSFQTEGVDGRRYLPSMFLLPFLKSVTPQPFTLDGLTNPVLSIGQARIPLGTERAPVRTVDILAHGLANARRTDAALPLPANVLPMPTTLLLDPAAPQLAVPGRDGDIFAVVQNILRINQRAKNGQLQPETLWVRAREGGRIAFTDEAGARVTLVNSQADLDRATARGQKAAVVYRLKTSNLQRLTLTPVPAAQVKVTP